MKHGKHHGKSEHTYSGEMKGFHGSPMESHESHGGKEGVPRELTVGSGPGRAAMGIKPSMSGSQFEGGEKTSGKAKGLKITNQGGEL